MKSRKKDIYQQAYETLSSMKAFDESKEEAVANGTFYRKIFTAKTFATYWEHIGYFLDYIREKHPKISKLKTARKYVPEWLQMRVDQNLSAWTIQTEAKALGKLYGIRPGDKDYFICPKKERASIKRSRIDSIQDRHFSKSNNDELIKFCKGTGARRSGLQSMLGKDLKTRQDIETELRKCDEISLRRELTQEEKNSLKMCNDALSFEKVQYFIYLKELKRERFAPIVGPNKDQIIERIKNTPPNEKVWKYVHTNADISSYRADYANTIYLKFARKIEDIPYDKYAKGIGHKYQSDVWHGKKDEKGKKLDKRALRMASLALGLNRGCDVAYTFIRGI